MHFKLKAGLILILTAIMLGLILTRPLTLGLDLQGGMRLVMAAKSGYQLDADALKGVIQVLQNRVDGLGVSEPIIRQKGLRQIIIELPGIDDTAQARRMIGQTALLEFVAAEPAPRAFASMTPEQKALLSDSSRVATYNNQTIFLKETVMTGQHINWAQPTTDQNGSIGVDLTFTPDGAQLFYDITARLIGQYMAIVLDNQIISMPVIREAIPGGKAIISGTFTPEEVKTLVIQLKTGALPVPLDIISDTVIGPSLGQLSLEKSRQAGIIGLISVIILMIGVYKIMGVLASISLIVYGILILGTLIMLDATLTLPGIAGIILTLGMAVDANIIIFERIRDERRAGQSQSRAITQGFARASRTIIDANITTLIGASVLFWLGTGVIKGFAVTLTSGVLISMITALGLTHALIGLYFGVHHDA